MLKRLLYSLLILVVATTAAFAQPCPTINTPAISTNQACIGDVVTLTMGGGTNLVPGAQTVDWYSGSAPGFDPLTAGTYVGSAQIVGSAAPCANPPIVLGGIVNPCNGSNPNNGSEENEAMFIWSGGGFNGSDLGVEVNNLGGATTENIGTLGSCPLLSVPTVPATGGCVVLAGPSTIVPANAFVLVFTSSLADISYDFSGLCALGFPVYIFQNSCTRLQGPTVPGAFSNSGSQSYMADFGCPGPNQSLTYTGSTGNNSSLAGWNILGINFPAPCNGTPFIPAPPTVPTSTFNIDPFNYTVQATDCGQQYFSAVVAPPVAGCPPQTGVGDLSLFVECPEVTLSGSETICVGTLTSGIRFDFSGFNPPYTFTFSLDGSPQTPVTTSDNPFFLPVGVGAPGVYTVGLVSVNGTTCPATISGTAVITAIASGPANPISATFCANDQPIDLTTLEDPAVPGGTWSGPNVTGSSFDAGATASGPFSLTYTPPAGSSCTTPGTATITIDPAVPIGLVPPPVLCGPTTFDLNTAFGGSPAVGVWSGPNLTLPSTFNAPAVGGVGATFVFTFTPSTGCFLPPTYSIVVSAGTPAQPLDATVCVTDQPLDLTPLEDPAAPGGTWSGPNVTGTFFNAGPSASGNFPITYTPPTGSGCSSAGTSTITVTPATTPLLATATACVSNSPIDLSTLVVGGFPTGTWTGPGVSGGFFNPASTPLGTYTITFTPTPGTCSRTETTTITVVPAVSANLGTATLCVNDPGFALVGIEDPSWPGGVWSGPGVSGGLFNPAIVGVGTTTITYSPPAGQCAVATNTTITVTNQTTPILGTATVCVNDPLFDLTTIEDPAFPTGTWSGSGVSGSFFNPSSTGVGPATVTFTPSGGSACEGPASTTITVTNAATPLLGTFTTCQTAPVSSLTGITDPSFPNGTWSGPGVTGNNFDPSASGTGPIVLTFTPVAGSCALTVTTTVTIIASGPAQPLDATICATDQPFDLTTLDDPLEPGGFWSGANVTGTTFDAGPSASGTFTVTYQPPFGGCTTPGNATITISAGGTPTLSAATVCVNAGLVDLIPLQDPAFSAGSWSGPGASGSFFDPTLVGIGTHTLTFTPTGGCLSPATTTITVSNATTPVLAPVTLCVTDPAFDLVLLEDPAYTGGTWTGPSVTSGFFNPNTAGVGIYTLTYTVTTGCVNPVTTTATVTIGGPAQPLDATICASDQPLNLTTLEDPASPGGTWSGANVTGSTFDAGPTASGSYTVTYTPLPGGCATPGNSTITISAGGTPTLGSATVCISGGLYDLFLIQDPSFSSGAWSGAGVSGSFFDPTLVGVGTHNVTFTPTGGCLSVATTTVTVSNTVTPTVSDDQLCVSDAPLDLSTLEDPAYTGGIWTGPSVSGGFFDPSTAGVGSYILTYTASGACVGPATSTITVTQAGAPVLATATVCETEIVDLTTLQDPSYSTGVWSGTNVSGTSFTAAGLPAGTYALTFTPSAACAQANTTNVTVFLAAPTSGRDTIICAGSTAFALDMMLNGGPIAGTWSGPGVAAGQFDAPNVASGTYGLTFTPATGVCALPTMIQVTVQVSGTPTIADQTVCTTSPTVDLSSLVPAQYAGGVWSGANVTGNSFDPSAVAPGNYRIIYTPGGACTNPVTITITVSSSITLTLPVLAYCIDAGVVDLTLEDPAAAPGGTWSGPGVVANQLDPSIPGGGNFTLTYTPPAGGCATTAVTTQLEISPLTTVGIFTDTVCAGTGPIDLSAQLDPAFATGSWSGSSVTSAGIYTPTNTAGPDQVTFTPQGGCYSAAQFTFDVVGVSTLSAGQPTFTCAPNGQTYIATISVTTTPNNGTITTSIGTLVGSILTITGLVSGTTNSVIIDDAATCNAPITLDVSFNCPPANCTTDAGTLAGGPYELCFTDQFTNAGAIGSVNDGDDVLVYFLDNDTDPDNGFIDQSLTPQFAMPAGLAGQTFFFYALSGNDDGSGGVSAVDNCRSQSNALEVTWGLPISVVASAPICDAAQDAYTVEITVTGGWPSYLETAGTAGSFIRTAVFLAGPFPTGSVVNLSFDDAQGCGPATITVTHDCSSPCVIPDPGSFATSPLLLCDNYITDANYNNDAVLGANDVQFFIVYGDAAGTIELGRFPSLPIDLGPLGITNGIVYVSSLAGENDGSGGVSTTCFDESPLRAIQLGQTQQMSFDTTVCSGTAVLISGTTYTDTNNTGSYMLSGFGASCDTVVNVTVNFTTGGGTTIDRTDQICNNETLTIGGQIFSASNPSDTFTIGATACDTTYRVALVVLPPTDTLLRDTLCVGDRLIVGNVIFDESNPSGTSVILARSGCDSIVNVELEFLSAPVVSILGPPTYCAGEDIEVTVRVEGTRSVMGDVFVNGNPTGSTILAIGDNTLTFPATSGFSFRLSNIMATTGSCAQGAPTQVSYSPLVSQLNADIPTPLSGEFTACNGNTVASIIAQPGNGIGPFSYAWSTGDTTSAISDVGQGSYAVTITDDVGCMSMTTVEVGEGDTLAYTLAMIDPICPNGQGSISISLDEFPQNAEFRFDLPGLDPLTSPDLSFDNLDAGTYVFQLIQENGCDQSTLITIEDPVFYDIIRFDTIDILLGDSARIFLDLPNSLDSIRWIPGEYIDCDTCERVLVSPPFDLEYEAIAYTTEGCEVGDRVFIRVAPLTEIYIPTAFSPNGDRLNDRLLPYGGPEVELIESFLVFDRWGNELHRTGGFAPGDDLYGWDGTHRGQVMNPAVFVALATVRFKNGTVRTFTGDVLLVR
ncbi:MAG: hypothetical protein AB8F78_11315 [Saprospiraceae bacterium]